MEPILFNSEKTFILLDYSPSHSELIIRHIGRDGAFNVDIFFKGVYYINLVREFKHLSISEMDRASFLKDYQLNFDLDISTKLFCLEDSNRQRYIVAAYYFAIFENRLEMLESPLGDFLWSNDNKQVYIS